MEFVEKEPEQPAEEESGLKEFLNDTGLSSDASEEEIVFLRKLRFKEKRPPAILLPGTAKSQGPSPFSHTVAS